MNKEELITLLNEFVKNSENTVKSEIGRAEKQVMDCMDCEWWIVEKHRNYAKGIEESVNKIKSIIQQSDEEAKD